MKGFTYVRDGMAPSSEVRPGHWACVVKRERERARANASASARIDRRAAEQYRELAAQSEERRADYLTRAVDCEASANEWDRLASEAP